MLMTRMLRRRSVVPAINGRAVIVAVINAMAVSVTVINAMAVSVTVINAMAVIGVVTMIVRMGSYRVLPSGFDMGVSAAMNDMGRGCGVRCVTRHFTTSFYGRIFSL
jgi:hypothetical protein